MSTKQEATVSGYQNDLILSLERVTPVHVPPYLVDEHLDNPNFYHGLHSTEILERCACGRRILQLDSYRVEDLSQFGTNECNGSLSSAPPPYIGMAKPFPRQPLAHGSLETPTGSISKDIAYPELSIQSPQYTAQADRGTSVLPPYAVPLRGIALSGPCSPLGFLDGGDRHDWSQILASLDCYGSNETNSLTSFAQPLGSDDPMWLPAPLPVDPPSPLAVRNALPSTGSNPATKDHQKRQAGLSIVDIATLSRAFTDQSPHPDTTRRTLLDEILRSSFYLENEHEPQLSTLEADIILVMAGLDPLADCVTRKGSIYSLLINAVTMACLICDKTHGTTNRALGCVRKHLGHRPFVCKGMRDRCRNCLESCPARFFTLSHLQDHISKQNSVDRCPYPTCNAHVRLGGIRRHYKTMHPFEPFPDMKAERKRAKRELELSSTSSVLVGRE